MSALTLPLHAVAHARAGDKGNRSSIVVAPYLPGAWPHLLQQVTETRVLALFAGKGASAVIRYELPNLPALNFVIDNALEGGVNGALTLDMHGKSLSFLLLGLSVEVPRDCVPEGSPYLKG